MNEISMKHILYAWLLQMVLLNGLCLSASAQTNEETVQGHVDRAQEAYDNGAYYDAIQVLDSAIVLIDTTTAKIQFLKTNSYYDLAEYDTAVYELALFFEIKPNPNMVIYKDMVKLSNEIDRRVGRGEIVLSKDVDIPETSFSDQETWDYALRSKGVQGFRNYLKFFPEGKHAMTAKSRIAQWENMYSSDNKKLLTAVKKDDMQTVRQMLKNGANVNYTRITKITKDRANGKQYDYYYESPLYSAVYRMDYMMTKYLLEQGANPNQYTYRRDYNYKSDYRNKSLLVSMIRSTSKNGRLSGQDERLIEFIDLMLDYGLDINFEEGSPLAEACKFHEKDYRRTRLIRWMLRKGADPKMRGKGEDQMSALDVARSRQDKRLIQTLKDKKYRQYRSVYPTKSERMKLKKEKARYKAAKAREKAKLKRDQAKAKEAAKKAKEAANQ